MSTSRRQHGLSLVELIIFMVVVSIGVVGILQVMSLSAVNSVDPLRRKQALAIAESMLEEVQLAKFTLCDIDDANVETAGLGGVACASTPEAAGPEAGNARPFDNVNDYVTAFGAAQAYTADVAGNPFPAGYAVTVTVSQDGGLGPAAAAIAADGVLRITVTVNYGNDSVVLDGYRTRYAPQSI